MEERNLSFRIETITPQLASEYLKHNTKNRPVRPLIILFYASEMKEGNWRENPTEPISFATDGTLIDGQHRLMAVEKSGVSVNMAVVRGVNPKDFEVINTGVGRHYSDTLALEGAVNAVIVGASIKYYFELLQERETLRFSTGAKRLHLTTERVVNEWRQNVELYEDISQLAGRMYKQGKFLLKAEVGGISAYLIRAKHYDLERVKEFWEEISSGGKWKVLSSLRTRLVNSATSKFAEQKLTTQARRVLISKAWNYFIAGEDKNKITYRLGDKYHFD